LNRLTRLLAVLAIGGAFLAAGCGDDDDDADAGATGATGVSGATLTEAEFADEANAICAEGGREIDAAANQAFDSGEPTPDEVEQFATEILVPGVQDQIDQIRALGAPPEISADLDSALEEGEAVLAEIEDDPTAIRANPFGEVNRELKELGLTACGSGG
jgi:hypothetical protein